MHISSGLFEDNLERVDEQGKLTPGKVIGSETLSFLYSLVFIFIQLLRSFVFPRIYRTLTMNTWSGHRKTGNSVYI